MVEFAPDHLPNPSLDDRPQVFPAMGERKRRVALLTGCAQRALSPSINDATIRILRRHGCEVVVAQGVRCCGALPHHMGKTRDSFGFAAATIRAWMREVKGAGLDAIVINTSGCGTVIKDYVHMFRIDEMAEDAATISSLAKDISELLSDMELEQKIKPDLRVAYHATCSCSSVTNSIYAKEAAEKSRFYRSGAARFALVLRFGGDLQAATAATFRSIKGA